VRPRPRARLLACLPAALPRVRATAAAARARRAGCWAPEGCRARARRFAAPVSDLAERAALPRTLVDLRHAATHNALPSLPALLLAANAAAAWLRDSYWAPQVSAPPLRLFLVVIKRILSLTCLGESMA